MRHLAVEDQNGQIVSVIDSKSLVQFPRYGPMVLAREIARAATADEVAQHCARTAPLAKSLLDSSARPRHVTHMLASICDAATERLIQLAVAELGPPPAAFAFIAMGSQGRQEQTLLTDQDNGIIFAPRRPDADPQAVADYFLRLGARVCDGLQRAGYTLCRGKVMASNPRWCRSLPDWIAGFNEWVQQVGAAGDHRFQHLLRFPHGLRRRGVDARTAPRDPRGPAGSAGVLPSVRAERAAVQAALPAAGQHLPERRRHGARRGDQPQRRHDADGQLRRGSMRCATRSTRRTRWNGSKR